MTAFRRLIAAATLLTAAALAPGLAAADERHERDRRDDRADQYDRTGHSDGRASDPRDGRGDDRFAPPAPAPSWATRDDLRWDGRRWVQAGWDRHEGRQRAAQAQAVRFELRTLDRERAAFHARFAFNPRRLARYDAGYLEQRAALERRLQALTWVACR